MRTRPKHAADVAAVPAGFLPGLAFVAAITALVGWLLQMQAGWSATHVLGGLLGYGIVALIVGAAAVWHLGTMPFGLANQVTLLRAGLVCLIGGGLLASGGVPWSLVLVGTVALVLDGVDGLIARRRGLSSRFGARFDLEIDALLLLILAVLVWQAGKVGAWVLAIGLMRYAFVLGGLLWPMLRRPLAPSRRRKAICVVQGLVLLGCLLPPVPPTLAAGLAALAVGLLSLSFAVDLRWLLQSRTSP